MDPWDPKADAGPWPAVPVAGGRQAASWRLAAGALLGTFSHGLALVFSMGAVPPVTGLWQLGILLGPNAGAWRSVEVCLALAEVLVAGVVSGALALDTSWPVRVGRSLGWIFFAQSTVYLLALLAYGGPGRALAIPQSLLIWWAIGIIQALGRDGPQTAPGVGGSQRDDLDVDHRGADRSGVEQG